VGGVGGRGVVRVGGGRRLLDGSGFRGREVPRKRAGVEEKRKGVGELWRDTR